MVEKSPQKSKIIVMLSSCPLISYLSLGLVEEHDGSSVVHGADAVQGKKESFIHPRISSGGVIDLVFWESSTLAFQVSQFFKNSENSLFVKNRGYETYDASRILKQLIYCVNYSYSCSRLLLIQVNIVTVK